jgi:tetratricopeptide (TPR) repeat protein
MAVRQYESIDDETGLGQTYNNSGEVYKKMGDYTKALEYLTTALNYRKDDLARRSLTLYNIAELYIFINDFNKAASYVDQSLSIAINTNNRKVIGYDYNGLGIIYAKQKKYQDALDYLVRAEKIWKEIGELRLLIQTYQDMADVYRELRVFDKAEKYLMLSMEMSSLIKVPDLQVMNYLKLSKLDSARGNYHNALTAMYKHTVLKDSVYNLAKTEQIARLQTMFESEAKELENQRLKSEQLRL